MRSEKEINERIKRMTLAWTYSYPNYTEEGYQAHKDLLEEIQDICGDDNSDGNYARVISILKELLEGESRYSIAELEKICQKLELTDFFEVTNDDGTSGTYDYVVENFIDYLKDQKKVQEALK